VRKCTLDDLLFLACGKTTDDKLGVMRGNELARAHIIRGEGEADDYARIISLIVKRDAEWGSYMNPANLAIPFYDLIRCIDYGDVEVQDMIKKWERRLFISKLCKSQKGFRKTDEDLIRKWVETFKSVEQALESPDLPVSMRDEVISMTDIFS
jgi:hypothetical protein